MKSVFLYDPTWQSTFPNRIEPSHNEWLASFMLRCDEVNTWGSGTTRTTLQRIHHTKDSWQATNMICPPEELLSTLADLLAVPQAALLATTYRYELISLYGYVHLSSHRLAPSFRFRICPQCVKHHRLIQRSVVFPQLQICYEHQLLLAATCQCGAALRWITRGTRPFSCYACGIDWGKLPQIPVSQELSHFQKTYLSYYMLFLKRNAEPGFIDHVLQIIGAKLRETFGEEVFWKKVEESEKLGKLKHNTHEYKAYCSLSILVSTLMYFSISIQDILASWSPWRSSNHGYLYYYAVAEMIANLPETDMQSKNSG
jgi:hypothetical protein